MGVIGSDECVSFLKIEFIGREHAATACAGQSTVPLFLAAMAAGANAKSSTSTSFIVTVVTSHNSKNGLELHQSLQSIPTLTNYLFLTTQRCKSQNASFHCRREVAAPSSLLCPDALQIRGDVAVTGRSNCSSAVAALQGVRSS
jgi:hypothetical protein